VTDAPDVIERRLAEWAATRDLFVLWPDVPRADLRAAQRHLRAQVAAGLRGEDHPTLPGDDPRAARALGIAAFLGGVGALVGRWLEVGRASAAEPVRALLAVHLDHARRRAELLGTQLARVRDAMGARGVEPIVLKGAHTGAVHFAEPALRAGSDLDLLVRASELPAARAALADAGLVERRRTVFQDRSEWAPVSPAARVRSLELEHADNPWSVDLHASLERWYFRGLRRGLGDDVFAHVDTVPIGGRPTRVLAEPWLTAFLAQHASQELARTRLIRLVELVLVIRRGRDRGTLAWAALLALLARTRTERFVQPALALAEELAPGTVPEPVRSALARATPLRLRRVVDAVRASDLGPLPHRSLDAKLMWAAGPRELLLGMSELLVPSDDGEREGLASLYARRAQAVLTGRARLGVGDRRG
jgi:hypothetical protein